MKCHVVIWLLVFILGSNGCRERYEMVYAAAQTSYLVVEGIINTQGATKVNLSRTTFLSETGTNYENDALLEIEGEDNSKYPLLFEDSGRYASSVLQLNEDIKYRLNIKTKDNRQYISSFVKPVKTPEIDSITWTRYKGGIEISVNAKDAINNTQYYKFDYDETWEFKSHYLSNLITVFKRNPPREQDVTWALFDSATLRPDTSVFTCWQSSVSTDILTGSTIRLGENKLFAPIVWYPKGAWQFGHLYTMELRQQGLSKDGYDFFQKIKKNTESLGSIFDAQPSEIIGNVKCTTDTAEKVVGFIDASRVKSKRIFIKNSQLKDWHVQDSCEQYLIPVDAQTLYKELYFNRMTPVSEVIQNGNFLGLMVTKEICVDCTLRGTSSKPSFWPN